MHEVLIVFTVLVPRNYELDYVREQGLNWIKEQFPGMRLDIQKMPADKISGRVEDIESICRAAIGITDEDIFASYLIGEGRLKGNALYTSLVIDTLKLDGTGPYGKAVFGLPSLCILGKGGMPLDSFVEAYPEYKHALQGDELTTRQAPNFEGKTVAVSKKYKSLVKRLLPLESASIVAVDDQAYSVAEAGITAYIIDIVRTGTTAKENGLGLFPPVLYRSDGVLLGNKAARDLYRAPILETPSWLRAPTRGH